MSGQLLRCTSFSSSRSPILAIRTPLWLLYLCFVLVCNFNPSGIAVIAKNYLKLHDCIDCKQSLSFPSVFLAFLFGGFREQKPTTRSPMIAWISPFKYVSKKWRQVLTSSTVSTIYLIKFTAKKLEFKLLLPHIFMTVRSSVLDMRFCLYRSDIDGNLIQRFDSHMLIVC